ncbi:hypothetical protein F5888DRAFT_1904833 [Russula emetica]|nr:hypothetical protein F5888DRAFT_1904833 [Russula emetica]
MAPPKERRMRLCLATLHTFVVADTILFEEIGWEDKDRFVIMDTGRTVEYYIVLNNNTTEIAEKVKDSDFTGPA